MNQPPLIETPPMHWLLRVFPHAFHRQVFYIEVADPNQSLEIVLGPAWESLHADLASTFITIQGKDADPHQEVGHLPFTPFFVGDVKWGVVELSLKPRSATDSVKISACGNLPVPEPSEPSFLSDAFLSPEILLACIEEVLLEKSVAQKTVYKYTVVKTVLDTLRAIHHVEVEHERVLHAIDTIARKFKLMMSPKTIHLEHFRPRSFS